MIRPAEKAVLSHGSTSRGRTGRLLQTARGGRLLLLMFVLTILEGAIRKWLVPQWPWGRYGAYFAKDVVFVLAALAGAASAGAVNRRNIAWILTISLVLILPPSLLNLGDSNPIGALLSFRAFVLLPWCAFLAAGTIRNWKDVDAIVAVVGLLAIGVAALGLWQFRLPPDHWLNRYDISDVNVSFEYGHVRAVGPFSYIAGMAAMAGVAAWAGMYFFLSGGSLLRRAFGVAVAASGLVCGLVSMSRGGVVPWILIVALAPLCSRRGRDVLLAGAIAAIGVWLFAGGDRGESTEPGFYQVAMRRFENADTLSWRIGYTIQDIVLGITLCPMGSGLGLGQPGGYAAENTAPSRYHVESELGRIAMEVGVPGLLGVVLIRLMVLGGVARQLMRSTNRRLLALCSASLPFLLLAAITNLAFNHTLSSFFWGIAAMVYGCRKLQATPGEPGANPPRRRGVRATWPYVWAPPQPRELSRSPSEAAASSRREIPQR